MEWSAGTTTVIGYGLFLQPGPSRCSMTKLGSLITLVDDDESVRESLPDLLKEFGFTARAFSSADEFVESDSLSKTKCMILDIAMRGMTGPELWAELKRRGINVPVIFITARRDEGMRARLIQDGAVDCLFKPFADTALLDALNAALGPS
jgi:FixJ family two-component response regulator